MPLNSVDCSVRVSCPMVRCHICTTPVICICMSMLVIYKLYSFIYYFTDGSNGKELVDEYYNEVTRKRRVKVILLLACVHILL